MREGVVVVFLALLAAACVTSPSTREETEPATTELAAPEPTIANSPCPTWDGIPIVWEQRFEIGDADLSRRADVTQRWPVEDSMLELISAYWARPSSPFILDSQATECLGDNNRWLALASEPPGFDQPFDMDLWQAITANPWRHVGSRLQTEDTLTAPEYEGVVLFTDPFAAVAGRCGTSVEPIALRGAQISTSHFTRDSGTPSCNPPPGFEPLGLDDKGWQLPIRGRPAVTDGSLSIASGPEVHHFVAITTGEFEAEFRTGITGRDGAPLSRLDGLAEWEASH